MKCRFCQSDLISSSARPVNPVGCAKCHVPMIQTQEKNFFSAAGCVGGLLAVFGIFACLTVLGFIPGLILIGLGIIVGSFGGKHDVLRCPICRGRETDSPGAKKAAAEESKNVAVGFSILAALLVLIIWLIYRS